MKDIVARSEAEKALGRRKLWRNVLSNYQLYLLLIPAMIIVFIFSYVPIYGITLAFKNYKASLGIIGSPWVGLEHFISFFHYPNFWRLMQNTFLISLYSLIIGTPLTILLAISFNEIHNSKIKKFMQTVSYAPNFISLVVICSMITLFLNQDYGLINLIINLFGGEKIDFLTRPEYFKTIYVASGVWQSLGWSTIIYTAALSSIDPQLLDAAAIDGATRLQKIWYVDLPGIMPTMVILLIINIGGLLGVGFEKILLIQNPLNMESSDVISTYSYRIGILGSEYGMSTAIGLFNSLINFLLLSAANMVASKVNDTSLW